MDAHKVLTTTRSVRKRMDFDRPVPRELILECIEVAVQAPTGSNRQGWHFMVVTDRDKKKAIGDLCRRSWEAYSRGRGPRYAGDAVPHNHLPRLISPSHYLAHRLPPSPALPTPRTPRP